jgi:hypothetical protein
MHLFLAALLTTTGAHAGKKDKTPPPPQMPSWFLTPPDGCGGGSAVFDINMREISKIEADTNARAELTRQIQTQVSTMVTQTFQKSTGPGGGTNASANTDAVTKSATDVALLGARAVSSEVLDGHLYLLLCIEPESLVTAFQEMAYLDDAMRVALGDSVRTTYAAQTAQLKGLGL